MATKWKFGFVCNIFLTVFIVILGFCKVNSDVTKYQELSINGYTNYDELTSLLQGLTSKYPSISKLHSIGKSVDGRELWVFQITDEVSESNYEPGKPMFKYVANLHGNEAVGRQLLIYLIEYLLDNYESEARIKQLVDTTNIFLMPSANPDGFHKAKIGDCAGLQGRGNEKNVDLNRDFPDQFDANMTNENDSNELEPETIALMKWIENNKFVLSANLHGGSVVASYPYDDSASHQMMNYHSSSPDDDLFKHLAKVYADKHKTMHNGNDCPGEYFAGGITNGAEWYDVPGTLLSLFQIFVNLGTI